MFFGRQRYILLADEKSANGEQGSAPVGTEASHRRYLRNAVLIALLFSLILNIFLIIELLRLLGESAANTHTTYGTSHLHFYFHF